MRCFSVFSFLELIWKLLQTKKQNKIVSTRIGTFLPHWQDSIDQPSFSVYTGHRNNSEFCNSLNRWSTVALHTFPSNSFPSIVGIGSHLYNHSDIRQAKEQYNG